MLFLPGYKVLNCLHEGLSSTLYRAIRLSDEHPVVVKVSTQKALTEKKTQRFKREFELGQKIDSSHVTRYLELKEDLAYGIALVMEDDQAVELSSVIPPQGYSNQEFLEIAIQIVQGLQAIHAANIIHNDLKASNILIQPTTNLIKIIDFNQASTLRQTMQSAIPMMVGTLGYISPEQTGRINRSVDYRTDFYSLGVVFYQLLCGKLPFMAKDALGFIHQHLATKPQPPHYCKPTIALPLTQIVMKLLEKEAENRYQSCEGILYDLTYCLSTLKETGNIPEFKVGQQDFSNKLTLSQHLYGRENEIKILINTFERIGEGKREVLMVAGEPGVGKTMLIQEILKPVALKNGFFIKGKFDQLNKNVAYSAITHAFDNFIKQLLAEDEASIIRWKNRLLAALGTQVRFIIKIIPKLALLIGEQPAVTIADINQAKNMLHWVFQEFIKICATVEHPLVLFLDDLQWADQASLELMLYLLQQPNISYLLWIGAYRDTEVTASHPMLQAIATLQEAQITVQTLKLAPLPLSGLQQWIADSLHISANEISLKKLVKLIEQKTAGNPFFVKLFLQTLYDQQLLTFSLEKHWQWDLAKVRQHPATENVIRLMTYQIQQLPVSAQQALSLASCLGHRLSFYILQAAMNCSQETVYETLRPTLDSGILIQTDGEVNFAHDRVQEAAYHLLPEIQRTHLHLTIGQRLLASSSNEETWLFDIVNQFNRCCSLITEPLERLRMARLNLKAGQKAKQATAYTSALSYFYASQDWVDIKTLWQTDYPLAFTWHRELAEVEYLTGHIDNAQTLIADMQPYLQSIVDKIEIYHLQVIQKIVQGQQQEAILIGHQALQLLGGGLPLDNPKEFTEREMPLLKQRLSSIPLSSLLNAPLVIDPEKQAIFKILADLSSACYQISSELMSAITVMSINLSLAHGHVPESCVGYVLYGVLLCTQYQEYALGYEIGNLAIQLAEKLQSPEQHCRSALFMYNLIYPWSKSIQELPAKFSSFFEEGITCGEIEYAGYLGDAKVHMLFDQGAPLTKVQQQIITNLQFAHSTKTKGVIYNIMRGYQRVVANLAGETKNEEDFDYNSVDEIEFQNECQKSASGMALGLYYVHKVQALYIYSHFKLALQHLDLAKSKLACMLGFYTTANYTCYDSLTRLALYPNASLEVQQAYLQQVTQNQQQMQKWQDGCKENFAHKYRLVEAELARIKGSYELAEAHYDQAIALAGRYGFIQEQALAAELAARYWLTKGKSSCAQGYLNIAFNGYKQWGAKRKLAQLKAKYSDLLHAFAPPSLSQLVINSETTLSSNSLKFLDLSSILKASQTISSEIELPKFLRSMMQIIIENAGAEHGAVLFVEADQTIVVQAEYAGGGMITTLQEIPLGNWNNGAQSVIQYVKRTRQTVVLDNAITHEQFKTDPYIYRTQAKSILCIPLIKRANLRAILYVENNLISYAFTPERVQTVLILTAQMAISLENARYFSEQLALTRQLTEQSIRVRTAEESLHAVTHDLNLALQASKAGTWNWQINTNKITWDAANYALFGLKPGEFKGTYAAVLECVYPDDREQLIQDVKRCIEEGALHDMEYRVVWPDGSQHIIAATGRVYRDQHNQPIKMTGVCLDVTQRRQLEQERLEALKQVEEKERKRAEEAERYRKKQEEFIDNICHEIRNPLLGITGNLSLLHAAVSVIESLLSSEPIQVEIRNNKLTEQLNLIKGAIHDIELCAKHQKIIIDDTLDLSRLEASKIELKKTLFYLNKTIYLATKMLEVEILRKQLSLFLNLPEEDMIVKGDPTRLTQILLNLLSNAIKYTPEKGKIVVSLDLQIETPTQINLNFIIEDTGVGITEEEKALLFERFANVSQKISHEYGSSGLGLVICKDLIKLMGGKLDIISKKGEGTKCIFNILCDTVSLQEKIDFIEKEKQPVVFTAITKPISCNILVVDDNKINQKVLGKMIEQIGYTYQVANNGSEAYEKYVNSHFDIIFMDIEMPILDGFMATEKIRRREKQEGLTPVPIIATTGYAREDYRKRGLEIGMNDLLAKPYMKEDIRNCINQYVKQNLQSLPAMLVPVVESQSAIENTAKLLTTQYNYKRSLSSENPEAMESIKYSKTQ